MRLGPGCLSGQFRHDEGIRVCLVGKWTVENGRKRERAFFLGPGKFCVNTFAYVKKLISIDD